MTVDARGNDTQAQAVPQVRRDAHVSMIGVATVEAE